MVTLPLSSLARLIPSLSQVTSGSGSPENHMSYLIVFPAYKIVKMSCKNSEGIKNVYLQGDQ